MLRFIVWNPLFTSFYIQHCHDHLMCPIILTITTTSFLPTIQWPCNEGMISWNSRNIIHYLYHHWISYPLYPTFSFIYSFYLKTMKSPTKPSHWTPPQSFSSRSRPRARASASWRNRPTNAAGRRGTRPRRPRRPRPGGLGDPWGPWWCATSGFVAGSYVG